jgi:hypothetical protein
MAGRCVIQDFTSIFLPGDIIFSDLNQPKVVPKDKWYAPPAKPPDDPGKEG